MCRFSCPRLFLKFESSTLVHFFLGDADQFFAQIPHLSRFLGVCHGVRLIVFENFSARTSSPTRFAIFGPASDGFGTSVPTPVYTRLVALRIVDDLSQSFSGFLLADISTGYVLHEGRENLSEPISLFAEESGLCDTAGVHAGEYNSGILVVSSVQFGDGHHVANLGVFVCLGSKEWFSINHGNWLDTSLLESFQVSKIRSGVYKTTSHGVGVSGNRSDNANASSLGTTHVVQQHVHQQKVSEMVDTHGHFKAIVGPCRFGVGGAVHGSVTDQVGEGSGTLECLEVSDKVSDGLKAGKFQFHARV
mmetsp:Transcript_1532/g.3383  ORF Transcript_1532/g.3383 Transcript_1532/m.3383 type:complete len:305 (+) Transcript_1532:1798-2712(+)